MLTAVILSTGSAASAKVYDYTFTSSSESIVGQFTVDLSDDKVTDVTGTVSGAVDDTITGLVATITAGGQTFTPCVVSKTLSQLRVDPVTIIGAALLTGLTNKTIGTMRHRKEKTVR